MSQSPSYKSFFKRFSFCSGCNDPNFPEELDLSVDLEWTEIKPDNREMSA